jgi:Domain of unknown function (DUF4166)
MTTNSRALFPELLGQRFHELAPAVRAVHGGADVSLRGTADVTRGNSAIARFICRLGGLPHALRDAPVHIRIEADGHGETWTRWFGDCKPMRSRLRAREGLLVEQLGPMQLRFRLAEQDGAVAWRLQSVFLLGVRLPRRAITTVTALSSQRNGRYHFQVDVNLALVGHLIGYRGVVDEQR